ncbi:hypothetical protein [Pseudomonas donghuensis]|uniref:Uncharacterized protein n=1 Tax=Pseudomonas donghuensis TaxID=1163398 RepID=A0AAQ0DMP4_9PSED|nr:hypothetical protein [Pseudomonas donghuensis]MCP6691297.1 hypothetical protein [Pseudomonas donghuensis]MDF9893400.1 hypothetical protein [Pseudomonas vranovensis]QWE81271.1 hypothetical protein BV82_13120 [Pseudomonas donghuensis]
MSKTAKNTFTVAGGPMTALGIAFAAVGASGQPAFGYTAVGLLIPGVALIATGIWSKRRQA